ncbi:MAG: hypothetical protein CMN63_00495, partial [Sphingobium sp.]|nr:hypothetical protein [Sphingobium sp.]
VWDPSDEGPQPRGKQVSKPRGIWYTPVTGIWQTVWLEAVPMTSIESLRIVPDVEGKKLKVRVALRGAKKVNARVKIPALGARGEGSAGSTIELGLKNFELWSPGNPKLYDLEVELVSDARVIDRVESYFGMRKIALGKDQNGIPRILLNGEPLFQFGPLDQGWWPDGLYTAPSDEALRYDLEVTRKLGFNMVRKHVKVEPLRWYYHCDRMGLLVWQDMPNGGANARWPLDGTELRRDEKEKAQFDRELDALIDSHCNQVSIVAWVPFNEAWGQFDTARVTRRILRAYPTHYPPHITEQAAIAGALVPGRVDADAQGVASAIAARLDMIAEEYERGWQGRPTQDAGIRLTRTLRGVEENRVLDGQMLRSGESRRLGEMTGALQDIYGRPAHLVRKDRDQPIFGPLGLLQAIFLEGEKGLSLQRYKGLGEMNPDQLWETTLDPGARTMLQVRIEDVAEAEDLFTKLMGDVVEPRREFIQQNALSVENLDI